MWTEAFNHFLECRYVTRSCAGNVQTPVSDLVVTNMPSAVDILPLRTKPATDDLAIFAPARHRSQSGNDIRSKINPSIEYLIELPFTNIYSNCSNGLCRYHYCLLHKQDLISSCASLIGAKQLLLLWVNCLTILSILLLDEEKSALEHEGKRISILNKIHTMLF